MIDFERFYPALEGTALAPFVSDIRRVVDRKLAQGHGDFERWQQALQQLPEARPSQVEPDIDRPRIGVANDLNPAQREAAEAALRSLHPWRKGPFEIFGISIDSEWRSNLKWKRLADRISPLRDRLVLDVGGGNGYYALRMLGAGARFVLAIDPTWLFVVQYLALNKYFGSDRVFVAPLAMEELPANMAVFDTVFSMGVLYHRRSPISHLLELYGALRPGGELVLETLVTNAVSAPLLLPEDRYAKMRNVWFIPNAELLQSWLGFAGFADVTLIDTTRTTIDEQRATDWMQFESLADFLDPADSSKTIEGLPAPRRAIVVAKKPD